MAESGRAVAVITGASSGIGKALALELSKRSYDLVLGARRADRLQEVAGQCQALGATALAVATDVRDQAQVMALLDRARQQFGRIDVMVNNAGSGLFSRVVETTPQQMRDLFDVNFYGVYYGCLAAVPVMMAQRSGHIFNVSSVVGKRGTPFHGAYSATKFALMGLSDALRVEVRPYGIHVTSVCPALTDTEFFDSSARGSAAKASFAKFKKMMPPETVARKMARTIGKDKPELVLSFGGKFLVTLSALWPGLVDRMMRRYYDDLAKRLRP